MPILINWNGEQIDITQFNISPGNRSFRYGDGCFETMKMINGKILLQQYHFERLFGALKQLKLDTPQHFNADILSWQITELAKNNNHLDFARIRLTIYRKEEENQLPGHATGYIIQTFKGDNASNLYNKKGLKIGIYPDATKSCDLFSSIKSNNYLPYIMAKIWAQEQNLDDAIVCNCFNRIADTTIANIFIVENGIIKTPPISEGCINGVMRRNIIAYLQSENLPFTEEPIYLEQLLNAKEVFLTNAIIGIKWVSSIEKSGYTNEISSILFNKIISPLLKS